MKNSSKKLLENLLKLIRLHQPTGIFLLFLPCACGIFLALKKVPNPEIFEVLRFLLLFLAGSFFMRSAGCIINDMLDCKFDQKVSRTKNRPLANKVLPFELALLLLCVLLFAALEILLQFNSQTIVAGFVGLALVVLYPLMKRLIHYPQAFLGLTFNFGVIMTSLAIIETITNEALILYFCLVIWTMIYDTIYAFQDIEDDLAIGVKSSAIRFQKNPKKFLHFLVWTLFISLTFLGIYAKFGIEFFTVEAFAAILLSHKISKCDFKNAKKCLEVFKFNFWVGALILTAIILG
jgi:4-hydroxybenzoate polyprenyltransferase